MKMRTFLSAVLMTGLSCLNAQCQKMTVHKNDGTEVDFNTEDVDSITFGEGYAFDLTKGRNGEPPTVRLSSGTDILIDGGCTASYWYGDLQFLKATH